METKEKSKRGKAIIGIALAAIMVASVMAAMVPTGTARDIAGINNNNLIDNHDTIYIGEQGLSFDVDGVGGYGDPAPSPDVGTLEAVDPDIPDTLSLSAAYTVPSVEEGKYYADTNIATVGYDPLDFYIFVKEPLITGDIILNTATQDTVVGKAISIDESIVFKIEANFGGKLIDSVGVDPAKIKIVIKDSGGMAVNTLDSLDLTIPIDATATTLYVSELSPLGTLVAPVHGGAGGLELAGLSEGTYTVTFEADKPSCNMLSTKSAPYEFTVRSAELGIKADKDTVSVGENMVITVSGDAKTYYYVIVTGVDPAAPPAISDAGDVKARDKSIVGYDGIPDTADDNGPDGVAGNGDDSGWDGIPNNADDWAGPDGTAGTGDDLPELRPDGAAYAGPDGVANTVDDIPCLAAWVQTGTDGRADLMIDTTNADDRTYKIKVYDPTAAITALVLTPPPAVVLNNFATDTAVDTSTTEANEKKEDVRVEEAEVTFDIPVSAIIGETVTIRGTVTAGGKVDVLVDDVYIPDGDEVDVDGNKEFEVEWDTGGMTTGSYTIDVYIDCAETLAGGYAAIVAAGEEEEGSTSIRLIVPGLDAEQPRNVVAENDEYTIEGTATGVDAVDIVLIGPDGYTGALPLDVTRGLEVVSSSVTDNEFSEDIRMGGVRFDTGQWIALVLSPGRDVIYETPGGAAAGGLDADIIAMNLAGKNQDQILAVIKDGTIETAGSDDLLEMFAFKVESAYVELNPVATVAIGEPLNLTGTTNREPETRITISTFAGPMDLPTALIEVEWSTADEGEFSATIDTTDAVPGIYTLEADDGDGNTDTITVELVEEIVPVATATPTAAPTAAPTAVPTPEATAEPTATPTEEPGFEAVFAIAGLLSIAYLVLRRKK